MIMDLYDDAKVALAGRRQAEVDRLIETGASHELVRGRIQGIDLASDILKDVVGKYSADAVDEHGDGPTRAKVRDVAPVRAQRFGLVRGRA